MIRAAAILLFIIGAIGSTHPSSPVCANMPPEASNPNFDAAWSLARPCNGWRIFSFSKRGYETYHNVLFGSNVQVHDRLDHTCIWDRWMVVDGEIRWTTFSPDGSKENERWCNLSPSSVRNAKLDCVMRDHPTAYTHHVQDKHNMTQLVITKTNNVNWVAFVMCWGDGKWTWQVSTPFGAGALTDCDKRDISEHIHEIDPFHDQNSLDAYFFRFDQCYSNCTECPSF